ncbi:hypothetical protein [Peptoniphilus gorbachii]|uniref:hypothetical protein n=1 Tax=Peptoniphilus gorbachii TaxID=411567 RepID=UPI0019605E37|nr:hypothetical protein [Peptoniphilus gorbachii]
MIFLWCEVCSYYHNYIYNRFQCIRRKLIKKQIKLIASTLVFATLLTTNTFAISYNSKNESFLDNKVGSFYFKDGAKAMNNPFFYETEQDPWSYQGKKRVMQKEASDEDFIYGLVSDLFAVPYIVPKIVMDIIGKSHHVGETGTIESWKSEKRRYKTSQITGKKQLDSKWVLYRVRFTNSDGEVLSDTTNSYKVY